MMDPYRDSAARHDELNAGQPTPTRLFARDFAERHGVESICDFGCGTGALMAELAADGRTVFGCDLSEAMCSVAQERLRPLGDITVANENMVTYRPPVQVDLATCLFDSINYLLDTRDWFALFGNVAKSLRPSGHFILDFVTEYDLRECWPAHRSVIEREDWVLVRLSAFDVTRSVGVEHMIWHVFQEGQWKTLIEEHRHAALAVQDVVRGLADVGLRTIEVVDADSNGVVEPDATTRIRIVARKENHA